MHINTITKCDVFQVYFVLVRIEESVKYMFSSSTVQTLKVISLQELAI